MDNDVIIISDDEVCYFELQRLLTKFINIIQPTLPKRRGAVSSDSESEENNQVLVR